MEQTGDYRRVLSIETATFVQTLALLDGDQVLARRMHRVATNHSETLLRNVGDILDQHRLTVPDLDLVCAGVGPGSFTALRVGLSTAKGLARAAGCPIVGISSLAALARPVCYMHDGPVAAIFDARRKEVYAGVYRGTGDDSECLLAEKTWKPADLHARLSEMAADAQLAVVGDGIRKYDVLSDWPDANVRVLDSAWDSPSSVSVALLGRARALAGDVDDLAALEPNYIRLSDAEISLKKRAEESA